MVSNNIDNRFSAMIEKLLVVNITPRVTTKKVGINFCSLLIEALRLPLEYNETELIPTKYANLPKKCA